MEGLILGFQFTFGVIGALAVMMACLVVVVGAFVIWSGK